MWITKTYAIKHGRMRDPILCDKSNQHRSPSVGSIAAKKSSGRRFQPFSFVSGVYPQPTQERESVSSGRDRNLGAKLNVVSRLAAHDRPDVGLVEADDAVRDASSVVTKIKNVLLSDQPNDHQ